MEKNKKASRSTSTNEINVGNAANATHTHQTLHSDLGHIGHLKQNGGDVEKKMVWEPFDSLSLSFLSTILTLF